MDDFDRYLLIAMAAAFGLMSLTVPRALATGRAGWRGSGPSRSEDPADYWFTVLLPPLAASAAIAYLALGGGDAGWFVQPLILLVFGFRLVRGIQTGRFHSWDHDRADDPDGYRGALVFHWLIVGMVGAVLLLNLLDA